MDAKWLGSFLVSSEHGKGLYTLASLDGNSVAIKRINGAHLKVYRSTSLHGSSPPVSTPQSPEHRVNYR